jgi:hypothetical protein
LHFLNPFTIVNTMKQIIGKIFQKPSDSNEKGPEPMLALSISAGIVKATVWELKEHSVEILGLGTKVYSDAGKEKGIDYKNLLDKAADAIDLACQVAETDVKKTIFGFPQSWIVENELLPEYDDLINKLAKSLDLEASAYVSIPHAISYYLQYLHKTAPTAILVGSSREGATVSYVESGKIKETTNITWSGGSFGKNIDLGLLKFKSLSEFPPLICLYGFGDLSTAREDLAKYNWSAADRLGEQGAPKFLSSPKVMVLEEHVDSLAVSLVGGKDLAKQLGVVGKLDIKSLEYSTFNSDALAPVSEAVPVDSALPFGFVMHNENDLHSEHKIAPEDTDEPEATPLAQSEMPIVHQETEHNEHNEQTEVSGDEDEDTPWEKPTAGIRDRIKIPSIAILKGRGARKLIGFALALLIVLGLGGFVAAWAYWNLPTATVTVYVKPDNLDKQVTMSASEKATSSASESMVAAKRLSVEIKSTKTIDTTGKSSKGTYSSGTVTVYNKTDTPKTFNAGTEIKTNDNKKFKLSENVTIASASADIEGQTNGKSDVKVAAVDFGPEGNIEKDVSFTVNGNSKDQFEAISSVKFSGGTKQDIKVVAAADKTTLSKQAKDDILSQIQQQVRGKVSEGEVFMDKAWQITKTIEKFDKNTNDESDKLTVETTQNIDAFVFKQSDVEEVLSSVSQAAVPDGYELKDNNKETKTEFVSLSKDGTVNFTAITRAAIIPKINEQEIAKSIIGKKEDAARQTIMGNSKVFDVSFDYSTRLPDVIATLPHLEKNITVKRGVR